MSTLGMWHEYPHEACETSAAAHIECSQLVGWVHVDDCRSTARVLMMLVGSIGDEKARYAAAQARHDHAAMDEAAGELRDLTVLAGICKDHLRSVGYAGVR